MIREPIHLMKSALFLSCLCHVGTGHRISTEQVIKDAFLNPAPSFPGCVSQSSSAYRLRPLASAFGPQGHRASGEVSTGSGPNSIPHPLVSAMR